MILRCPKCRQEDLVDSSHGASRCPACRGMFVPVAEVHRLMESGEIADSGAPSPAIDAAGGQCPADRGIMARTTIPLGGDTPTLHLERCGTCHSVWFDAGEWAILSSRHLLEHIDEFWSNEWRDAQRRSVEQEDYHKRLENTFGAELYGQIRALGQALRSHPRRSQALAVLREESESRG